MNQLLNNIWIALSTENTVLMNIFLIPLQFIEGYLSMKIFLTIFNVKASKKQVFWYVLSTVIIGRLSDNFILAPFNIIFNYSCIIILIKLIFGFSIWVDQHPYTKSIHKIIRHYSRNSYKYTNI